MRKLLPDVVLRIVIPYLLVAILWSVASHAVLEFASLPLLHYWVAVLDDTAFAILTSALLYHLLLARERALEDAEASRRRADMIARRESEELAAAADRQALELNTVFSALPDGILVFDADGKIVRANAAARAFYSFDPVGRTAAEMADDASLHWPDGPLVPTDQLPSRRAAQGTTVSGDFLIRSRNEGREIMATVTSSPLIINGEVTGVVSAIHDVTEHRKLLAQLAAEHAELVTVVQQMPIGVILAASESATALLWNEQVEIILGHRFLPGLSGERRAWAEDPCPAGLADDIIQEILEQALRTGEALHDREIRFLRKDGSCATVVTSAVPIHDQEGRIAGVLATLNDVTGRKEVEETLRRSNMALKSLSVQLTNSLATQQTIEEELRRSNLELERSREELEQRVEERTQDLARANESLELRVAERTGELATLLQVSRQVASTPELGPLLNLILDQLNKMMGYNAASIFTLRGDNLSVLAYDGPLSSSAVGTAVIPLAKAPGCERVCRSREPVIWSDGGEGSGWAAYSSSESLRAQELLSDSGSWLGVPMVVQTRLIGMLRLEHDVPGHFTAHHAQLAAAMADLAAIAFENARLYREAKDKAALDERQRLARELHDSVSQSLYGMALGTQAALEMLGPNAGKLSETLNYVLAQATSAVSDMRALIYELRPELVERVGLVTALSSQAESLPVSSGLEVHCDLCPEPDIALDVKDALYRIAHQALQNVVQHAEATQVDLRLECDQRSITLAVWDNGLGFDPDNIPPDHLGVASMRERTARLHGTISIESRPGSGTKIAVRIPLGFYRSG